MFWVVESIAKTLPIMKASNTCTNNIFNINLKSGRKVYLHPLKIRIIKYF